MHKFVQTYEENAPLIQKFITSSLRAINLNKLDQVCRQKLFTMFPSIELIYQCDINKVQNSPNFFRDQEDESRIGIDRSYLIFNRMADNGIAFLNPYVSTATGTLVITAVYKAEDGYILFDMEIQRILERFNLIETASFFRGFNRISYGVIGLGLTLFGVFIVLYGFYSFGASFFDPTPLSLDVVFKPVIALTLGLAVYDLGKTIVDQEVRPKTKNISKTFNAMTLMNFSTSIIIALLIEALLIVFKISIQDYHDLPYASGLIASLAILLLVFSIFIYLMRKSAPALQES